MDASKRLLTLCTRKNGKITRFPERLRMLDNGVEHYFVKSHVGMGFNTVCRLMGKKQ